jgi:hypothetical protein
MTVFELGRRLMIHSGPTVAETCERAGCECSDQGVEVTVLQLCDSLVHELIPGDIMLEVDGNSIAIQEICDILSQGSLNRGAIIIVDPNLASLIPGTASYYLRKN